ncbi:MAG: hypothetical protein NT108_02430 [Candidatus Kaiserbacteria bacterium]|nr:hypothetical protein [Candidatus Kaiserbacteria bacterium]
MEWPKSVPPPCDSEIFRNGKGVCIVAGNADAVERWVRLIAHETNARLDWHYNDAKASVLYLGTLGTETERHHVLDTIRKMEGELDGYVISIGSSSAPYRAW